MGLQWYVLQRYYPLLLDGFLVTILYTAVTIVTSLLAGLLIAVLRFLKPPFLTQLLNGYVTFLRETPLLVQLYFIYFALPFLGIKFSAPVAAVLAITLNESAFIAEILRGGIQGIHKGQHEASHALAMTRLQSLRLVILPQAIRNVIPTLSGQCSIILKDTSLLSAIAISELLDQASAINDQVISPTTVFGAAGVLYLVIFAFINKCGAYLEKRA